MSLNSRVYGCQYRARQWAAGRIYRLRHGAVPKVASIGVPDRVLLIVAGMIGDTVMSTPVISEARRLWPRAQITVLGQQHNCEWVSTAAAIGHCDVPTRRKIGADRRAGSLRCALFVGRLDLAVNQRALFSFADEIWPKVDRRCRRRLRVVFAGGVPDEQVLRRVRRAGIEVRPSPSSAELANLFSQAGVQLCPVTSGTGIKIKTLEAMAYGKGVVGYPSAFRGISAEHQRHALIAESAEQSAELLELSLSDDRLRRRLGEAAQGLVRDAFDPPKLGTRLVEAYATVHARGPRIDAPTAEDPSLLSTAGLA